MSDVVYELRSERGTLLARDANYDELEWIARDYRERGWKLQPIKSVEVRDDLGR